MTRRWTRRQGGQLAPAPPPGAAFLCRQQGRLPPCVGRVELWTADAPGRRSGRRLKANGCINRRWKRENHVKGGDFRTSCSSGIWDKAQGKERNVNKHEIEKEIEGEKRTCQVLLNLLLHRPPLPRVASHTGDMGAPSIATAPSRLLPPSAAPPPEQATGKAGRLAGMAVARRSSHSSTVWWRGLRQAAGVV